ncbi:MAG: Rsd/AlgQ family anti-sigma factor [Methylomicrobium sp.]
MQTAPERRLATADLIDKLKHERHEVWAMYCRLAELKPFTANHEVRRKLAEFSQLLVDYVSFWHFCVDDRLLTGSERRQAVLAILSEMYPKLTETTDAAIVFNDKYEHADTGLTPFGLLRDLSVLGENLAIRMDLEDRLCRLLMS